MMVGKYADGFELMSDTFISKKFFCHLNQQKIEKELEIQQIKKKKKTFDSDKTSRTWKIFWFW